MDEDLWRELAERALAELPDMGLAPDVADRVVAGLRHALDQEPAAAAAEIRQVLTSEQPLRAWLREQLAMPRLGGIDVDGGPAEGGASDGGASNLDWRDDVGATTGDGLQPDWPSEPPAMQDEWDAGGTEEPQASEQQQQDQQQREQDEPQQRAPVPDEPGSEAEQEPSARYFQAMLLNHEEGEPLVVGESYPLTLTLDPDLATRALAGSQVPNSLLFPPRATPEDEVELMVQLDSLDFTISNEHQRPLRLRLTGPAREPAVFDIVPLHDGDSSVTATLHKAGNIVAQMRLTFPVGPNARGAVTSTTAGRPFAAAAALKPREVALSIAPKGDEYTCILLKHSKNEVPLHLNRLQMQMAVDNLRQALMQVVQHRDDAGGAPFQTALDIPPAAEAYALRTMAEAGRRLFQQLFQQDAAPIGRFLSDLASTSTLKVQIWSSETPIPWPLLYLGDVADPAELDWEKFLGMRHIIEEPPTEWKLTILDNVIASDKPHLSVGLHTNTTIDVEMGAPLVADTRRWWQQASQQRRGVALQERNTCDDVLQALNDPGNDDRLLYFYCHASTNRLNTVGGADASLLGLTDGDLVLKELYLQAGPDRSTLGGQPLVFINACESAELSPLFYEGFVPYFIDKGARGVVGTECKIPALFAQAWAQTFFEDFLAGAPLGEVVVATRRRFLEEHRNPLGLLYSVYCDSDTIIDPALQAR